MTYSEYRHSFATTEEFMKVFGKLSEEEANALISATNVVRLSTLCKNLTHTLQYGDYSLLSPSQ